MKDRIRVCLTIALCLAGACRFLPGHSEPEDELSAKAELHDASGQTIGTVRLREGQAGGGVTIDGEFEHLSPGEHGIHLHTVGRCDAPAFTTAGGHFNPTSAKHGLSAPDGPHAGDLAALTADQDGRAKYSQIDPRVTLAAGASNSLFDADGTAIVVHAAADDQRTDPSGNSGARVACGVVVKKQ